MIITTTRTETMASHNVEPLARLAALGFSRRNDEDNFKDTLGHCLAADHIQTVTANDELVGFALYSRRLWCRRG